MTQLCVNIDHVATIRQARKCREPDPVRAAHEAELGGAHGITVHLREDRRHIQDDDLRRLRETVRVRLNLEMAPTDEMVAIAQRVRPDTVMLVPEGRAEITTEGGLDVRGQAESLRPRIAKLHDAGLIVSAFIDPDPAQAEAAKACGVDVCEIHTGPYAHAFARHGGDFLRSELKGAFDAIVRTGWAIRDAGMRFNAGHALDYHNVERISAIDGLEELHIGHAIVSRAVYVGMREAVAQMRRLLEG